MSFLALDFNSILLFVSLMCVFDCDSVRTTVRDTGAAAARGGREGGGGSGNDGSGGAANGDGDSDNDSGDVTEG
jgi:hypothetical protein